MPVLRPDPEQGRNHLLRFCDQCGDQIDQDEGEASYFVLEIVDSTDAGRPPDPPLLMCSHTCLVNFAQAGHQYTAAIPQERRPGVPSATDIPRDYWVQFVDMGSE